jgi:hypothetical protein
METVASFTALLASNLLAQFSRQIVIQILGLESPKVCGNLAVRPLFKIAIGKTYLFCLEICFGDIPHVLSGSPFGLD